MTLANFEPRSSNEGKRTRYVYYPAKEGHMVKLSIAHREGGRNHSSGRIEKRGVQITISPIEVVPQESGLVMESTMFGDDNGMRLLIAETPRYSAKKIEAIVAAFDEKAPEIAAKWTEDREAATALLVATAETAARLAA